MTSLPDGCTCYDETTRKCPLPGHPLSHNREYDAGYSAALKDAAAVARGALNRNRNTVARVVAESIAYDIEALGGEHGSK